MKEMDGFTISIIGGVLGTIIILLLLLICIVILSMFSEKKYLAHEKKIHNGSSKKITSC